ncbi:Hypothetical_protein [Hexamita inflata]|uniref:Hypothetical_protein n=1 Tax=Hexamita inflata TaxID=28002 RepID=A0AA86TTY8_9EUKA|nr:Hypothetical protein HINF_LOCUS16276 [Hexamita inflata]
MICSISFYILSNILRRKTTSVFCKYQHAEITLFRVQQLYQDWSCQIQSETELILYNSAIINKDSKMKLSARIGAGCRETTRCAVQLFHQAKMEMSSSCSYNIHQLQNFLQKIIIMGV